MSRIHDALRKAEQDRAADSSMPSREIAPLSADPLFPPSLAAESSPPVAGTETVTETSPGWRWPKPVTPEEWIAACAETSWKLDPEAVLFTNSGEQKKNTEEFRKTGVEEFRTLRTQLVQAREKLPLQSILVTSALAGEGKTFVSANLAQVFVQQQDRRVLLIDADLRIAKLHELLGVGRTPGLTDYLRGEAEVSSIIQRSAAGNLFFIPAGKPVANPVELIGNGRLKALLHQVAPLFDWIVLDSPPCVPLSDASLLADLTDGVLMVVRSGKTPFDVAQKAREMFRERHLLGVVLNQVPVQAASSSYYYQPVDGQASQNGSQG